MYYCNRSYKFVDFEKLIKFYYFSDSNTFYIHSYAKIRAKWPSLVRTFCSCWNKWLVKKHGLLKSRKLVTELNEGKILLQPAYKKSNKIQVCKKKGL